jgi:hypothetical protein
MKQCLVNLNSNMESIYDKKNCIYRRDGRPAIPLTIRPSQLPFCHPNYHPNDDYDGIGLPFDIVGMAGRPSQW